MNSQAWFGVQIQRTLDEWVCPEVDVSGYVVIQIRVMFC